MKQYASRISGTGMAFPKKIVTNNDLKKIIETDDEWIQERTGIKMRRISEHGNESETNSGLGLTASLQAMEMAKKKPEDIDQIIYATCTADTFIPSTACWLQMKLGAKNAWGVDINAACSGFVYGVAMADQAIRAGNVKTSLVVGVDVLSTITNWDDRSSCILFGDGAGAAIVERTDFDNDRKILYTRLGSDGGLWELLHVQAGGSKMPMTPEVYEKGLGKMQMKGKEMYKYATQEMARLAIRALEENNMTLEDVDWFIAHQANLRIIEAVVKRVGISMDKVLINIDRYANTSSGTVPSVLDEAVRNGKIKPGHVVMLDAFGAGVTSGVVLLRW
jgi:3-oxoacyl-[acyl-carrier-protein] synthase III